MDNMSWTPDNLEQLRLRWEADETATEIAAALGAGITRNAVLGKAHRLGLAARTRRGPKPTRSRTSRNDSDRGHVRKAYASKGDDVTFSRWVKNPPADTLQQGELLRTPRAVDPRKLRHPSIMAGRSLFHRNGVGRPDDMPNVLVSGHNNVKIGRDVRKGPLRGYWIYTLSLEERATCPRTCHHWATCYGNNMPYAKRVDHRDPRALEAAIERDIARLLAVKGRPGILVRLHALGDFHDAAYVEFWGCMLAKYDRLACYGYTAWAPDTPIGGTILDVQARFGWERFAIRWSNGGGERDCTQPIRTVDEAVNSIVCPEQTGKVDGCGKCGLCWHTRRNIAFLEH